MYMDRVIAFGLLITVLTSGVVVYVAIYAWKHIKQDIQANKVGAEKTNIQGNRE